jgi:hypothetical protein
VFNEDNVAALTAHLPDGSFAHQLVIGASKAATRTEAKAALAKIVEDRVAAVRGNLDADD